MSLENASVVRRFDCPSQDRNNLQAMVADDGLRPIAQRVREELTWVRGRLR